MKDVWLNLAHIYVEQKQYVSAIQMVSLNVTIRLCQISSPDVKLKKYQKHDFLIKYNTDRPHTSQVYASH